MAAGAPRATVLGVRHHGPGSARAVAAALARIEPDAVLIEGPPEADPILALAGEKDMVPPVALLAHAVDEPSRAAFWPFASFSPEWVALRFAVERSLPVYFIDLPAAYGFALAAAREQAAAPQPGVAPEGSVPPAAAPPGDAAPAMPPPDAPTGAAPASAPPVQPSVTDPIAALAAAAGHDDPERWWEDVIEHRLPHRPGADDDPLAPFRAVADAMAALRPQPPGGAPDPGGLPDDALREAHMRQRIRAVQRAGHNRVAVICGAWHVPALERMPTATHDRELLRALPRRPRTEITWVPWTHRRLAQHTGYGAGIASPGWYHHLFTAPDRPIARWMTHAAGLLREADHPVSSAHVIEAVRLAEALAAMRGRPLAGLSETLDAVRAVLGDGSETALALVHDRLVVGDALGGVPDTAPAVPLQRDLTRQQRSLRLRPDPAERDLDLDLRKETDAHRSRLLHRLRLLGIPWGEPARSAVGSTGTFRETWRLSWDPELAVRVVEAASWGTTVEAAAAARAADGAIRATTLAEVTALAEACLLADLPDALPTVMRVLADRAALDTDVAHLAEALPALVRSLRYGDVRGTDAGALREVAEGLAVRVCIGLPPACTGLDGAGAAAMRVHLDAVHGAVGLLGDGPAPSAPPEPQPQLPQAPSSPGSQMQPVPLSSAAPTPTRGPTAAESGIRDRWAAALLSLARRTPSGSLATGVPGLLRGRAVRLLLDDGRLSTEEAARRMGLSLSTAAGPADAAGWAEGFLAGGGMLLVHDDRLLALLDDWISSVPGDAFTDVLPLLRRTFSSFEAGVRRTVGERIRTTAGPGGGDPGLPIRPAAAAGSGFSTEPDLARADAALATVSLLLGLTTRSEAGQPPAGGPPAEPHSSPPLPLSPSPSPSAPVAGPASVPERSPRR
ncbi:DUF5682 family protein [Peterkaempfera sp. SMS 1(5)a]|uniref:DUF5682 family protein n=1 Tax=Peterkaempfera podocarpi TaxID=3232308 RepID=UPI00366A801C